MGMKTRFKLFQSVIADRDLVEPDLMGAWGAGKPALLDGKPAVLKGTHGAIVEVFEKTGGIAVEFFDDVGETIDVAFIPENYVRAATQEEIELRGRLLDQLYSES
jgi:Domain of unknown function (DUF4926)